MRQNAPMRRFAWHYAEMWAAMGLGMLVLGMPAKGVVDTTDRPGLRLIVMAVAMTVPMLAWMRVRGHGWRPCAEMAAAMFLPTLVVLALLGTGIVTNSGALMGIEHAVMAPAMLIAMLLRRREYSGHVHRRVAA